MRIGDLAKKYNIPITNLYYYIKIGLIVPTVTVRQYYFDSACEKDLQAVLHFKDLGFSLKEISDILSLSRMSNMQRKDDTNDILKIMDEKYKQLEREKEILSQNQNSIRTAQEYIKRILPEENHKPSGLPVTMLKLLVCPHCHGQLQMRAIDMDLSQIYNAQVSCNCGYQAEIKNGVFISQITALTTSDVPDVKREYYREMPNSMITFYQFFYNWMRNKMTTIGVKDKIILETHLNSYCFLQFELNKLQGSRLILVDRFSEIIELYKEIIDKQNTGLEILYIVDKNYRLPVVQDCVDIFIDFFSSDEHQLYQKNALIQDILPHLKSDSKIIGTYFFLEEAYCSRKKLHENYPLGSEYNFSVRHYKNDLEKAGYEITEETKVDTTRCTGNNRRFGFHKDGEQLCMFSYLAEKINFDFGD